MKVTRLVCLSVLILGFAAPLIKRDYMFPATDPVGPLFSPPYISSPQPDQTMRRQISASYARLPLSFEPSQEQTSGGGKFWSRGAGYHLFLTATEAVLTLNQGQRKEATEPTSEATKSLHSSAAPRARAASLVRMKLVNANPLAQATGRVELPGKSNYFIGNNPAKWRTNVPNYAKVEYGEVWPGVDLVYYGNQRQLEYDFIVAPGADPRQIRLSFEGMEKLEIKAQGDLALSVAGGEVNFQKPFIYQEVNGARQEVTGSYALIGKQVAFQLGEYDATRPLVIDPVLVYSTYFGGSNSEEGRGIAVDSAGNVYITGWTFSTNFPTASAFKNTSTGWDVFVTKLNPDGSELVYSTYLGGNDPTPGSFDPEYGYGIAVDSQGNAYVTGRTQSRNFPTTPSAYNRTCTSASGGVCDDAFVSKLNPAGNGLVYSTYLGSTSTDEGYGIAVDSQGNACVTGITRAADFPTTPGAFDTSFNGRNDYFVTKFNPAGSALVYSTYLGGRLDESGVSDIAVDADGNAWVTGTTESPDYPTTPGAFDTTCGTDGQCNPLGSSNLSDVVVTKLNPAGSALVYSTFLGGRFADKGRAIQVDAAGHAYVTGEGPPDFPTTPGAFKTTSLTIDGFVTKFNPAGSSLVYSTFLTGDNILSTYDLAVDFAGNAWVTGITASTSLPVINPTQSTLGGAFDAFVMRLNATGSALTYSTYLGGTASDYGYGIAVDAAGNAYVAGTTASTNFPTKMPLQPNKAGGDDVFITKISEIEPPPTPTPNPTPTPSPATVRVDRASKTCTPTDAYPRIAAQLAAGPNFAAIPEQPPTQIRCTFAAEVVLDGISGNTGPVTLTIFDGFSPGLFFNQLTASDPPLTVASYTNNVLTFNPIQLALPPQTVYQRFRVSFEYTAFLNDLAEQRIPQQNCITLRFNDPATGRQLLERGGICADTNVLVPRLSLEKYASTTTGLPGDTLRFTVIAHSSGSIFLQSVDIDAVIPNNTTLVPGSIEPQPTRVVGNRIEWRGLGPINASGALPVTYAVTIDANTPGNAKLTDQAFAQATTPNFAGAGTRRLNASSNQVMVMVMSVRTGIDLTLTPAPRAGCPLSIIDYTARVTNTGEVALDRLRLSLNRGTEPVAGSPTFPLELEPLGPGESRAITYKGRIGLRQRDILVDVATVVGRPINNGAQVAELVGKVATAVVQVSPPAISRITPASGPTGSNNLELKIEGACFVPETVVSFQANSGIAVIDPTPPDFGFVGTSELRRRINILPDAVLGEREVFVTNPNGMSGGQRPFNVFTVTKGAPMITRLAPNGGRSGTQIIISGANFATTPAENIVRFGATQAEVLSASATHLVLRVPEGLNAGPGAVTVTVTGQTSNAINFSVSPSGAPDITATPATLDFGNVPLGQTVERTFTVHNPGSFALQLYAVLSSNPDFHVELPAVPREVPSGGEITLTARFTPTVGGVQAGTLLIASDAPGKTATAIEVRGQAPGGTPIERLATDDGTAETGVRQDGLIIVNRLTPSNLPVTLRAIRIYFAQFQGLPSPAGERIRLIVFAAPAGMGRPPDNPQLLVNEVVTIPSLPANGGFVDFSVGGPSGEGVTIPAGDIYVGFQAPRPARGVVFAADTTGPPQQRAFFSTNDGASYQQLTDVSLRESDVPANIMIQASINGLGVCSFTLTPGDQAFDANGGANTVRVSAPEGCNWTVSNAASWINLNSVASGAGNGTVNYAVAPGATPRRATMVIAGQPFTIAQAEQVVSVSSASYRGSGLAVEAIASAFGANLAATAQSATSLPLPTTLAGTRVLIKDSAGIELYAPLFFISPNQVNFLMPAGTAPGAATVTVINNAGTNSIGVVRNDLVAPGLFGANADGQGAPAAVLLRVAADGSQRTEPVAHFDPAQQRFVPTAIDLGPEGEQIFLILFGTGLRNRSTLAAVKVKIGGIDAPVLYAGPQGSFVGLDQINVSIPRSLAGRGETEIVVTADGRMANPLKISIK